MNQQVFFILGEAQAWSWSAVAGAAAVGTLIVAALGFGGCFRQGVLRRGPLREVDFSPADLVIGFGFVGMIYLDKLLLGVGGRFVEWSDNVATGIQQVASLALIAGAVFFFGKAWFTDAGLRKAGFVPRRPARDLWLAAVGTVVGVLLTFATLAVVNGVASAAGYPSPEVNHGMLTQLEDADAATVATIIIAAVFIGPLLEEIVFRGLLQTLLLEVLGRGARWTTVVIASALFASVHLGATTWHALPGLFVLGMVLGWLYERTGSLWPAVLVHAAFNGINIAMVLNGVGAS